MYMTILEIVSITLTLALSAMILLPRRGTIGRKYVNIATGLTVLAAIPPLVIRYAFDHGTWRTEGSNDALIIIGLLVVYALRRRLAKLDSPEAKIAETKPDSVLRHVVCATGLLAGVFSLAVVIIFPANDLDAPSGKYAVGTQSFMMEDTTRQGVYLDAPGQNRRLMVQAWYPAADVPKGAKALWIPDVALRNAFADYGKMPHFMQSHLAKVRSNSYMGIALAATPAKIPVVIVSHGWTGARAVHTDLAEELASRGMIVLGIDHPYGAMSVTLTDGTVLPLYPDALNWDNRDDEFMARGTKLVSVYQADIEAVLARVRADDTIPALKGRIDTGRIALAGHSTGAGAAASIIMKDPSINGMLGLDAWLEPLGDSVAQGSAVPQLHLGSDRWRNGPNRVFLEKLLNASPTAEYYSIKNSAHMDFAMLRDFTRAARIIGWGGSINQKRFAYIVNSTAADWLEANLGEGAAERSGRSIVKTANIPELQARN